MLKKREHKCWKNVAILFCLILCAANLKWRLTCWSRMLPQILTCHLALSNVRCEIIVTLQLVNAQSLEQQSHCMSITLLSKFSSLSINKGVCKLSKTSPRVNDCFFISSHFDVVFSVVLSWPLIILAVNGESAGK